MNCGMSLPAFLYKGSSSASFADVIKKALLGHLHNFLNKPDPLTVTSDFRWENQQKRKWEAKSAQTSRCRCSTTSLSAAVPVCPESVRTVCVSPLFSWGLYIYQGSTHGWIKNLNSYCQQSQPPESLSTHHVPPNPKECSGSKKPVSY